MFTGSSEPESCGFRPLDPEVSRPRAQSRLRRRRRWFSFRSEPLRLELIRLPVYIVEARFAPTDDTSSSGGKEGEASRSESPGDGAPVRKAAIREHDCVAVRLAVDALNGSVERLDRSLKLEPARTRAGGSATVAAERPDDPREGIVPPNLSPSEALARARSELPWLSLHFALRRGVVYSLVDMDISDRVGYPYWILHTMRRQRRDFRALDGISGKRLGARGRSLVVQGYILLARQEGALPRSNPVEGN